MRQDRAERQWKAGPEADGQQHDPRLVSVPGLADQLEHLAATAPVTLEQGGDTDPQVIAVERDVQHQEQQNQDKPRANHQLTPTSLIGRPAPLTEAIGLVSRTGCSGQSRSG